MLEIQDSENCCKGLSTQLLMRSDYPEIGIPAEIQNTAFCQKNGFQSERTDSNAPRGVSGAITCPTGCKKLDK